jgi:hypothetical protein
VAWISRHIQDNTISRENALSSVRSPEAIEQMNANLSEWYEYKEECDRIERSLTETTSPDIIRQLDDLGRRTLGHAWTPLLGER